MRDNPQNRKSTLESMDPGKAPVTFSQILERKLSGKATATVTSTEAKKPLTELPEEPDLCKDPVYILDTDLPMEFQPLKPNPDWAGVIFDPLQKCVL